MGRALQLLGKTFGTLTVERRVANSATGQTRWRCLCSCGTRKEILGCDLPQTLSCGGSAHPRRRGHGEATHRTRSVEYTLWLSIKARCYNPKTEMYPDYGGRGAQVADLWRNDFATFLHDIGRRPSPQHRLLLVGRDGHYEPSNVRWMRADEAYKRYRNARLVTWKGQTRRLSELCAERGLSFDTVVSRITTGWTIEEALETPARKLTKKEPLGDASGVIFDEDTPAARDLGARLMSAGRRKPGRKVNDPGGT